MSLAWDSSRSLWISNWESESAFYIVDSKVYADSVILSYRVVSCSALSSFIFLPCWRSSVLRVSSIWASPYTLVLSLDRISPKSPLHSWRSSLNSYPDYSCISPVLELDIELASLNLCINFCLSYSIFPSFSIFSYLRAFSSANICSFPF